MPPVRYKVYRRILTKYHKVRSNSDVENRTYEYFSPYRGRKISFSFPYVREKYPMLRVINRYVSAVYVFASIACWRISVTEVYRHMVTQNTIRVRRSGGKVGHPLARCVGFRTISCDGRILPPSYTDERCARGRLFHSSATISHNAICVGRGTPKGVV